MEARGTKPRCTYSSIRVLGGELSKTKQSTGDAVLGRAAYAGTRTGSWRLHEKGLLESDICVWCGVMWRDVMCVVSQNPKLAEHLARWGIDVLKVEKTDKTMAELEVSQYVS